MKTMSLLKAALSAVVILIVPIPLHGCDSASQPADFGRPYGAPFSVDKAGTKAEFEIRTTEHRGYQFDLHYVYDERNQSDRERVRELVGSMETGSNGKPINPGVPIFLRLHIDMLDSPSKRTVINKEISDMRLTSWGQGSFSQLISTVILTPGRYKVTIESLVDVPALKGTQTNLSYGVDAKTGPISKNKPH